MERKHWFIWEAVAFKQYRQGKKRKKKKKRLWGCAAFKVNFRKLGQKNLKGSEQPAVRQNIL